LDDWELTVGSDELNGRDDLLMIILLYDVVMECIFFARGASVAVSLYLSANNKLSPYARGEAFYDVCIVEKKRSE
jgi:hypothetical protein